MGALLVLIGIFVAVIVAPIRLFQIYRRAMRSTAPSTDLPEARVESRMGAVMRSGAAARRVRLALRTAVFRGLVPAWLVALALMLVGVWLA